MKRTIMIFPQIKDIAAIEAVRKDYDPLYGLVNPHISLVFTFENEMDNEELRFYILNKIRSKYAFKAVFKDYQVFYHGDYYYLVLTSCNNRIKELHDVLATDAFSHYHRSDFIPHITVGVLKDKEEALAVAERLNALGKDYVATIGAISVEEVLPDESSRILFSCNLRDENSIKNHFLPKADIEMIKNDNFEKNQLK